MAKKGTGKGDLDIILKLGVEGDEPQISKEVQKSFSSNLVKEAAKKSAKELGDVFAKSMFGGKIASSLRKEISEAEHMLKELRASVDKEGNILNASLLKQFSKQTKGATKGEGEMRAAERYMQQHIADLKTIEKLNTRMAKAGTASTKRLEKASLLSDSGILGLSESKRRNLEKDLAFYKKYYADLGKLQEAAIARGDKKTADLIGGVLNPLSQRLSAYSRVTDYAAAQRRVDKVNQEAQRNALAEQKRLGRDWAKSIEAEADLNIKGQRAADVKKEMARRAGEKLNLEGQRQAQRNALAEQKRLGRDWAKSIEAEADLNIKGQRAADFKKEVARRAGEKLNLEGQRQAQRNALAEQKRLGRDWAKLIEAEADLNIKGQRAADVKKEMARRRALIDSRKVSTSEQIFRARTQAGHDVIDKYGGLSGLSTKNMSFDEVQLAKKTASRGASYYGAVAKRQGDLGQDNSSAIANMKRYEDAVTSLGQAHKTLNTHLGQAGTLLRNFLRFAIGYQALYQVLGAVTALTAGVVKLDESLANIKAITASTAEDMGKTAGAINDVAVGTKFSTAEIADAAKILSQAGIAVNDLPRVLKTVADFAAATDSSLATAADTVSTMKEIFKDLSEEQIADQLTKAVNLSKLSGEDLQTILSMGAQVAAGFNVTSEQYLSAVSVLRNAGVKASTIATGMRQAMLEIFTPDDPTLKALQFQYARLGESLDPEVIKAKFYNFKNDIDPLLSAMTELKRLGFGAEGDFGLSRGIDVRAVNVMKELVKSTDQYVQLPSQFDVGQAALEGSKTAMDSLAASWDNLGSAITALAAEESVGLVKWLKDSVKGATELVEKLREAELIRSSKGGSTSITGDSLRSIFLGAEGAKAYSAYQARNNPQDLGAVQRSTGQLLSGAQAKLEAARASRASTDPNNPAAKSLGGNLRSNTAVAEELITEINRLFNDSAAEELDRLLGEYKRIQDDNSIQVKSPLQKPLVEKIKALSKDGSLITDSKVTELVNNLNRIVQDSISFQDQFTALYNKQRELALTVGVEGDKARQVLLELSKNSDAADLMGGNLDPLEVAGTYSDLMGVVTNILSPEGEVNALAEEVLRLLGDKVKADFAIDKADSFAANTNLSLRVQSYLAELASMGTAAATTQFDSLLKIIGKELGESSPQYQSLFTTGNSILKGKREADAKSLGEQNRRRASNDLAPPYSEKKYNQDVGQTAKANELDFQIEKLKKFGDATGAMTSLVQQRNGILEAEKRKEIAILEQNEKNMRGQEDSDKREKALNDARLDLNKLELQNKEEYVDALSKQTQRELEGYAARTKTALDAGDFKALGGLSQSYKATQSAGVAKQRAAMAALGMTPDQIQNAIDSNAYNSDNILKDKDINQIMKRQQAAIKAADTLVPKHATTGDVGLDARARNGLGFTDAENLKFMQAQQVGNAGKVKNYQQMIADLELLKQVANPEQAEQFNNTIEVYKQNIEDADIATQDLTASIDKMNMTAGEQLASVFNADGARAFTTALEQSGNVLKNWGDNIRTNLLTAWESVGDAIADAIIEGKSFKDSMKDLVKTLANDILRMTVKNMMNNLMVDVLGGGKDSGGGVDTGKIASTAIGWIASLFGGGGGAAPASGGGLNLNYSGVASAFGAATGGVIPDYLKFANGYVRKSGILVGPGTGTSDSIRGTMKFKNGTAPIAVSNGESILTAKATSMLGEATINALNNNTTANLSTGSLMADTKSNAASANLNAITPSVNVMPAPPQNITMINSIDAPSVAQKGLKDSGTMRVLANEMKANKTLFRQVLM